MVVVVLAPKRPPASVKDCFPYYIEPHVAVRSIRRHLDYLLYYNTYGCIFGAVICRGIGENKNIFVNNMYLDKSSNDIKCIYTTFY